MTEYETESLQSTTDTEEEIIGYYEANKTSISVQKKDYYKKNRDKILEKIKCKCGRYVTKNQLVRHQKTKVHQQYIDFIKFNEKNDNTINFD